MIKGIDFTNALLKDEKHRAIKALRNMFSQCPVDRAMVDEYFQIYGFLNGKWSIGYIVLALACEITKAFMIMGEEEKGRVLEAADYFVTRAFDYSLVDEKEAESFLSHHEFKKDISGEVKNRLAGIVLDCLTAPKNQEV